MVASRCYYQNGTIYNAFRADMNYTDLPYTFSKVNRHTVIGCYDFSWLNAARKSRNVSTGCMVFCLSPEQVGSDERTGNERIEAPVPVALEWAIGYLNVSFASLLPGESKSKGLNFRTLIKQAGNGADVSVPWSLFVWLVNGMLNRLTVSSWERGLLTPLLLTMLEILGVKPHGVPVTAFTKDGLSAIAMTIGTLLRLDSYTSNMCIQSLGRSSNARALIEIRADVKFKDTILLKKPSQTLRGVPVGSNVGFKPTKEYRHVAKKPNANTSCNKKKGVKPTKEICNSNPFDVLNALVYDEDTSTTPIVDKIRKLEKLIIEGKFTLVDDDGYSHILVLGDGAQMLGFLCLNGKDPVAHPAANIVSIFRPTENVLCGWVNCELSRPDANITFVLRATENILYGWVNCEVTHPDANIAFVLRLIEDVLTWLGYVKFFGGPPREKRSSHKKKQRHMEAMSVLTDESLIRRLNVRAQRLIKFDPRSRLFLTDGSQAEEFHQRTLDTYASHPSKCGEAFRLLLGRRSPLKENRLFKIVEPRLIREGTLDKLHTLADLVNRCLSLQSHDRPTMKKVAMELDGLRKLTTHPSIPQTSQQTRSLVLEIEQSDLYDARIVSMKGSEVGRGEKEKNKVVAAKDGVSPSVIDETVVSHLVIGENTGVQHNDQS
nr:wall-associated receptor kinase 5-like [Tanacetum cinerariifolium]